MKRNNKLPALALCVALAVVAATSSVTAAAEAINDAFGPAIDVAQKRSVKIFGAGIGRDPGYATGLLISPDGLILTAQGIYLSGERLRVALPDGSIQMAEVVRKSQALQSALLKVDAKTPDYFQLEEKMPAKKGDWVLAVSNAFKVADGPEPLSVNLGVLSLRTQLDAQNGVQDVPYEGDVVLIDAITSNPGAAGGAVMSVDGRLVGMVGRIMESKATGTRLNYAVPVDLLKKFVDNQEEEKPMVVPVAGGKSETGIRLFALSGKRDPAFVDRVIPNSPAAAAGFKPDDLVISINSERVDNAGDFKRIVGTLPAETEASVVIKRKDEVLILKLVPAKAGN